MATASDANATSTPETSLTETQRRARELYHIHRNTYYSMSSRQKANFRARCRRLMKKAKDEEDHKAVTWLDIIATRIGCYFD